jgi:predicted branched-subunit amino acid permease
MMSTTGRDLIGGARAMLPWLLGVGPFGLLIGVSAAQADIPVGAGWLTGPTIYGGSAQIAAIQMLDAGAAPVAVIITVLVISLRFVLYSAAMAPYWRDTPFWWRLLGGYLLVDPSFVVGIERYQATPDRRRAHAHYLGGAVLLWISWMVAIGLGATVGARVPQSLHLELLVPLFLIGEIVPKLRQTATRRAAVVSAVVALVCLAVPMHLGIAIGIVAGMVAGYSALRTPAKPADAAPSPVSEPEPEPVPALSTRESHR